MLGLSASLAEINQAVGRKSESVSSFLEGSDGRLLGNPGQSEAPLESMTVIPYGPGDQPDDVN